MKLIHIFIICAAIFFCNISSADTLKETAPDTVVLLHGLGRTARSMSQMEQKLKDAGYKVHNYDYESRKNEIESLIIDLQEYLESCCAEKDTQLNFVTHSLGGIIVRGIIDRKRPENLGRVVMLSPPNKGSETVDYLSKYEIFEKIFGPASMQLGTDSDSFPNRLGPADFELGIITGDRTIDPLSSWIIPGKDDGKVAIERTKLAGMADFLIVNVSHAYIMENQQVINETIYFLQNGRFSSSDAGMPGKTEE